MRTGLGICVLVLWVVSAFPAVGQLNQPPPPTFKSGGKIKSALAPEDGRLLDSIQQKSFLFFLNERHPSWGIIKDRTAKWAPASIAATGFGLPCFAIAAERKWLTREEAAKITLNSLNFFCDSVQTSATNATGYKGFYYHFLRMDSGTREWNFELSSV